MNNHTHKHHSPTTHRGTTALTTLLTLLLLAMPGTATAAETCPNQQAREQNNSTQLPDCRAYERVSPLEKNGGDITTHLNNGGVVQTTPSASRITYPSASSFQNPKSAPVVNQYLSTRTTEGWNTQNITQPHQAEEKLNSDGGPYKAFNANLTEGLLLNNNTTEAAIEEPPFGGAPAGYRDYYLHNLDTNTDHALLTNTPTEPPEVFNERVENLYFKGYAATPDLHHVILNSDLALTPGATPGGGLVGNLYEWSNGQLEAINTLPGVTNGETEPGARLGDGLVLGYPDRTISEDGSRIFWGLEGSSELYVRESAGTVNKRTINYGSGVFLTASTEGSKVFFASASGDLYEYDLESETSTDLTPTANPEEAHVQGVLGASDDGSYVYFVASGALAPGVTPQNCERGNSATGCNLYLWHAGGGITYIATLTGGDETGGTSGLAKDWSEVFAFRTARVSPDGLHVVFTSEASLTPYDNHSTDEVYEYTAPGAPGSLQAGSLTCSSCRPDGTAPTGPSSIPGASEYGYRFALHAPRVLSSDGSRVYFNSSDAISSADTNNKQDVYQWEAPGSGTCPPGSTGCTSLISSGTSTEDSTFADASENGSDVFFITRQQLTPGDTDQQTDLYDAHVNGGYLTPNPPVCTGTGCQGLPGTQATFATPPTLTFEGTQNLPAPPKQTVVKTLTRAQKLTRALKACQKKPRKQRPACQRRAHKSYDPPHKKAKKSRSTKK